MNDILRESINRGAPIDTPVLISVTDFLQIFDNKDLYKEYREAIKGAIAGISNIAEFHVGEIFIPTHATVTLGENNTKELRLSGENIFLSICEIFYPMDLKEIIDICESNKTFNTFKESVLKISTPEELKRKYPRFYELYISQIEFNKGLKQYEDIINNPEASFQTKMEYSKVTKEFLTELYPNVNLDRELEYMHSFSVSSFIERIFNVIIRVLNHAEEVVNLYESIIVNLNSISPEDKDKLDLFIAANYMRFAEAIKDNTKQRYLFHLTNYFKENVENKVTRVKIKIDNHKVTPITLYERYKNILVNNPDLLAVNFSSTDFKDMTSEEVEDFITSYLADLSANWELIPPEDTSIEKCVKKFAERHYHKLSPEEQKIKRQRLLNLYMEKKNFYDSTDPYFRIKGKNTFDGYVGYIYSNALVVLEKFYSNVDESKIAENEAIYVISMGDFYELSQHSKTYLIANHMCNRVIHKKGWQERVLAYINRKTRGNNPADDTHKLMDEKKITLNEKTI